MQMLYDSDDFVVVHEQHPDALAPNVGHMFNIVDKRCKKQLMLTSTWAVAFQRHIDSWQLKTPTQDEVEAVLDEYCVLAQIPLVIH
jgi:hypothetical protein